MKRNYLIIFFALLGWLAGVSWAVGAEENKPIWLAVTKPAFTEAIRPLIEHREKDGFETVISTESVEQAIGSLDRRPAFVLLVGDDEPGQENQPWYLPVRRRCHPAQLPSHTGCPRPGH